MEGSDWISRASSMMRRTPGDLVLRPMVVVGEVLSVDRGETLALTIIYTWRNRRIGRQEVDRYDEFFEDTDLSIK